MVKQQHDASVQWQSRISQARGTKVTDYSGGIGIYGSERLMDLLKQRGLVDRVERFSSGEHHK